MYIPKMDTHHHVGAYSFTAVQVVNVFTLHVYVILENQS